MKLPKGWVHTTNGDTAGFACVSEALQPNYDGENSGYILVRGEWNGYRQPIEPLWNQHITKLSVMLGAKKIGAAPWRIVGGSGFEAEIMLPKKTNMRVWVGILSFGTTILHFMVSHPKEERERFEPLATQTIRSLSFIDETDQTHLSESGCPIPPGYISTDPKRVLSDLIDADSWQAYTGRASTGALQAYYLRELPAHSWEITTFSPYPNKDNTEFARIQMHKGQDELIAGIFPIDKDKSKSAVVLKHMNSGSTIVNRGNDIEP